MSCDVNGLVCPSCHQNTSEVYLNQLNTWRRQLELLLLEESRRLSGSVLLGPSSLGLGLVLRLCLGLGLTDWFRVFRLLSALGSSPGKSSFGLDLLHPVCWSLDQSSALLLENLLQASVRNPLNLQQRHWTNEGKQRGLTFIFTKFWQKTSKTALFIYYFLMYYLTVCLVLKKAPAV